jgi:ABC-2 type transport system permease protein
VDNALFSERQPIRSLWTAAWLGWQIESNWTDPFLFSVYSIAKPLALTAILVVMFGAVSHWNFSAPLFVSMYVGNAVYLYVGAVLSGMTYAVIDDRERYRTLKSIYVAPVNIPLYFIGRGAGRFVTGTISVAITLILGIALLRLPIQLGAVDWLLFAVTIPIGLTMLASLGLLLASVSLLLGQSSWYLGDMASGCLFLVSGAAFPLDVLPRWLHSIGRLLPLAHWIELVRRALLGSAASAFPTFQHETTNHLLAVLLAETVIVALIGTVVFRLCDRLARERWLIDRTTTF